MGSQAAMLPPNYTAETVPVKTYTHPIAAFFHCAAKVAAVISYLLCGLFSSSYVINFVVTAALLAIDFWIVKNVTGRLLVGLRWWNDVDEHGQSTWKFESLDQQALERINRNDSWIFWWPLYINTLVWTALAIIALIRLNFDYLVITIIGISLTTANTAGYSKCRKDAERRAQTVGQGFASSLFQAALGVSLTSSNHFLPCK
ncbi:hypothetical protein KC19_4G033900 [Ceratodon purpureus]|uniref:Golgi apparatus membrane protein TVP23 n=1 Tax=Ceratodon purpureus TaxID=3225 RepID=A0A8T0I825_CERPU|nr:hypothetical protein KC19_4G033900 [Ceratodon purpureus]